MEEAAGWQALGFSKIAEQDFESGEAAYARALGLYQELEQASKYEELHAELAWLSHERGVHDLARKHLAFLIPDHNPATLETIRQPSACWCCFHILQTHDSETALALLKNGYNSLQEILTQISDPNAREHYLYKLPYHAALVQAWKENGLSS